MDSTKIVILAGNETLPRTVMTSVTILLALGALLIWGGHVLRGFTAVMILGVIVGTYSSIYVSSSLLITLGLRAEPPADKPGAVSNAERVGPKSGGGFGSTARPRGPGRSSAGSRRAGYRQPGRSNSR